MIALAILILFVALGAASYFGWTADSRNPDYTLNWATPRHRPTKRAASAKRA